jgi:hypothetical protein
MQNAFSSLRAGLLAAALVVPAGASAQLAFLTTDAGMLYRINLSDPGQFSGTPQSLGGVYSSGLAVRPGTDTLYALGANNSLVYIRRHSWTDYLTVSGVWTQGAYTLSGTHFGFNFHPTEDRIRVVSDAEQNLRVDPVLGTATTDTPLAYAAGDPYAGADPNVVAVAYENNGPGGGPTMYAIDYGLDILAMSAAPNEGVLRTVGALGVSPELVVGFDIRTVAGTSTAYAVMRVAGTYGLYTIDLGTGGASLVGDLPPGETFTGFAVAPALVKPPHDVNGDYRSEILYRNVATGQVYRMLFHAANNVVGSVVFTEPDLAWSIVADGDFDGAPGEGTVDLLWRNSNTGDVYFMPFGTDGMPAAGGRVIYSEPNPDWHIVQTPDLNGDGNADLVWYNTTTGRVYGMLLDGGDIIAQGTIHVEPNLAWSIVATSGPSRGGRRNQLVWRNSSTGAVYLMTVDVSGSAFTTSGSTIYVEPDTAWRIVGTPDLDGDGHADLLWRNGSTGEVYGMLMNGSQIMAQGPIHSEPDMAWKIVAAGDYNWDGMSDLLWRNEATGLLHVMLMNRLTISYQLTFYRERNLAWKVLGPYEYAVQ